MSTTITLITAASLITLSTAQAQTGDRALLSPVPGTALAQRFSVFAPGRPAGIPGFVMDGEQALLGRVQHTPEPTEAPDVSDTPTDGARALLGRPISASSNVERSGFVATLRGSAGGDASGGAEFGPVRTGGSAAPLVLSLGTRDDRGAILFTHASGAPLDVGRYRISDQGDGVGEIRALVTTGSVSHPTGVFHGRSGWLVVTRASDDRLTGRFHVDAAGFLAAAPELEDRTMVATGSFSAVAVR